MGPTVIVKWSRVSDSISLTTNRAVSLSDEYRYGSKPEYRYEYILFYRVTTKSITSKPTRHLEHFVAITTTKERYDLQSILISS